MHEFPKYFHIRRRGPFAFDVFERATGAYVGAYGGRERKKWADLADGTVVLEDSPLSVGTVRGLLVRAWIQQRRG